MGKEERTWGMACHLASLAGLVVPFGNVIGPLVIWLIKKDEMPFVDDQGKESLNFQINLAVYLIIAGILTFVFIGFLLFPIIGIFGLVYTIIASIKSNEGISYRYPLTIRVLT